MVFPPLTIQETDEIDGKEGFVENPFLTEAQGSVPGQGRNGNAANGGKRRIIGSLRIPRRSRRSRHQLLLHPVKPFRTGMPDYFAASEIVTVQSNI